MRSISFQLSIFSLAVTAVACGSSSSTGGEGGQSSNGGTLGTGGVTSSGGSPATGGVVATGGVNATGGTTSVAGSTGTGRGGATETGGTLATGGLRASGGVTSLGGTTSGSSGGSTGTAGNSGGNTGGPGGSAGRGAGGGAGKGSGGSTTSGSGGGPSIDGGTGQGCTPPSAYKNLFVTLSGHTQAESDDKVSKAWSSLFNPSGSGTIYYNGPGSDESYVEDLYNNDVRTEGMGYGMMIAVQLDHQTEFDRLWKWVKTHMANGTGEISWSCSTSGGKNSSGGAPDGEEYMATALIFAHTRWGDTSGKYNYATEAQWVLDVIRTKYFNSTYHIVKFVSSSNNTDPSYVLPAFYQAWACFDTKNADFWNESVKAGREFFHNAMGSNGVIPDQTSFDGKSSVKGPGADTIRCVVNIMMDWNFFAADSWQSDTYAVKYGDNQKNTGGGAQGFCDATLGFGLPASSGKSFVDKIWSAGVPSHNYWDGVLYMLALLHVSGNFHLWY